MGIRKDREFGHDMMDLLESQWLTNLSVEIFPKDGNMFRLIVNGH